MANRQQLRRLKQDGVEAWNQWRRENPEVAIDLRGGNLKGLMLRGVNLNRADIRGANFVQADLTGGNIAHAEAGLQKHWAIFLTLLAWLGAVTSGTLFNWYSHWHGIALLYLSSTKDLVHATPFLGCIFLYILLLQRGLSKITASASGAIIFFVAIATVIGLGLGGFENTTWTLITAQITIVPIFCVVSAIASAVIIAVAGVLALLFMLAGSALVAFSLTVSHEPIFFEVAFSLLFTLTLPLLNAYLGWQALLGNKKYVAIRSIIVAFSALGGTSFRGANLSNAEFHEAKLKSTDFRSAIIIQSHWHKAKNLDRARFGDTILNAPAIRDLAVTHDGRGKNYTGQNLKGINLRGADLSDATLTEADLSDATLENAILERANLTKVQALRTQFCKANLTAACLEAWNIDSTTQLQDVICDHVYLLNNQQERRPNSGNFAPGEFTKLFQEVLDTIDLIFRDGVDWRAFVQTFRDIQVQNEDTDLAIQSIENKGDGVVVVKVQASGEADKAKIHAEFSETYQRERQILETQYRAQLEAKDSEIASYRRENANMLEITKLLANKPITVKAKAVSSSQESTNHFNAPVSGIVGSTFTDKAQVSDNSFNQTHNTNSKPISSDTEVPSKTILFLAANPTSTARLRLDTELREIDESLKRSQQRNQFTLINKGAVRNRDFYRAILDTQPKIIHFSGHGTDQDGLALEDDQGNATFMGADQLEALFEMFAAEGVECVLLNACYSKTQATAIRQHIPHVIGMNQTITDKAGIEFAIAFYDSLGAGKDVNFAFKLAKSQLIPFGEHKIPELLEIETSSTNFNNA